MMLEMLLQKNRKRLYKCNVKQYQEDVVLSKFEKAILSIV